jgi:ABC-type multidrug transport system ATPase subunit
MSAPTSSLAPLVARGLVRTFAARPVLDGVDLVAAPGTRVGLIGENGAGKSTLLRLLAGRDLPDNATEHVDRGSVQVPDDLVHLPQEPDLDEARTVGQMLDDALRPLHDAVAELERLADRMAGGEDTAAEYDRVLSWAVTHDAWDADRRAEVTATTLGVGELDRARPVVTLSGGQRTRLALAAAPVRRPACLRGPTDNDKFIHAFKGGGVERARARRVHDAERRLETAEREALPKPPAPLRFRGTLTADPDSGPGLAVSVRGLRVDGAPGAPPRVALDVLDVPAGEKLLVSGPNGSGKSTLLAVLAGVLAPDGGLIDVGARRVGFVAQDPDVGPLDRAAGVAYAALVGAATAEEVPLRTLGLLHPRDHGTAVGALSVRAAPAAGARGRRRDGPRPAAARRADQPRLVAAGLGARGGPGAGLGHGDRHLARPVAARPVGGSDARTRRRRARLTRAERCRR